MVNSKIVFRETDVIRISATAMETVTQELKRRNSRDLLKVN